MWKWLTAIGAMLLAALQVVTVQRNKARQAAKEAQRLADTREVIRQAEQRIAKAQAKQREEAEQIQHELDTQKHQRPVNDFGDSRLHNRKD